MKEIKKIIKLSNKIDNKGFFKIVDKIDGSLPKKQIITPFHDSDRENDLDINKKLPIIHITTDLDSTLRHGLSPSNFLKSQEDKISTIYNIKKSENIKDMLYMISKINTGDASLIDVIEYSIKKARENLDEEGYNAFISDLSFILGDLAKMDSDQIFLAREYLFNKTDIINDMIDLIPNKNKKNLIYNLFKKLNYILSIL